MGAWRKAKRIERGLCRSSILTISTLAASEATYVKLNGVANARWVEPIIRIQPVEVSLFFQIWEDLKRRIDERKVKKKCIIVLHIKNSTNRTGESRLRHTTAVPVRALSETWRIEVSQFVIMSHFCHNVLSQVSYFYIISSHYSTLDYFIVSLFHSIVIIIYNCIVSNFVFSLHFFFLYSIIYLLVPLHFTTLEKQKYLKRSFLGNLSHVTLIWQQTPTGKTVSGSAPGKLGGGGVPKNS